MSGKSSQDDSNGDTTSSEGTPPPLPARPSALELLEKPEIPVPFRPQLQSKATTGVSRAEVQGHAGGANSGTTHISVRSSSPRSNTAYRQASRAESLYGDRASISSTAVLSACGPDFEPLFDDFIPDYAEGKQAKRGPGNTTGGSRENEEVSLFLADRDFEADFKREFNDVRTKTISEGKACYLVTLRRSNANFVWAEQALHEWKTKLKHYLILSAAGKPIWSRHGDDGLISSYIGVLNTIISSYEDTKDHLRSFTAGETKFILLFKGPVQLVAISRLHESDSHLHAQLEALYMQVVSTLTMPSMERMFSSRPSTDLRRALQGTEKLLSALADGFTRGSPSTLLSALECLTMKKRHRDLIDSIFLTNRSPRLLYGLIVARGRLVSVVRPRKHSLHPGDLQLIFNMLFEAGGIRVRGGDNWIPLCLPAFNDKGYLYMFVSFLDGQTGDESRASEEQSGSNLNEEITILLISTSKDSFYELRKMRDDIAEVRPVNRACKIINNISSTDTSNSESRKVWCAPVHTRSLTLWPPNLRRHPLRHRSPPLSLQIPRTRTVHHAFICRK